MPEKHRVQFDFDERLIVRIDALVENDKLSAESRADIIREAVRVYDWITDLPPDTIIEVCDKDGNVRHSAPVKLLR